MERLATAFLERTRADLLRLDAALGQGPEGREEARRIAHMIAGSAGLFGFQETGTAASVLEEALEKGAEEDVTRLLARLQESLEGSKKGHPG